MDQLLEMVDTHNKVVVLEVGYHKSIVDLAKELTSSRDYIAELEKQNEELREDACAANMLATERKANFDAEHKRAAELKKQLTPDESRRVVVAEGLCRNSLLECGDDFLFDLGDFDSQFVDDAQGCNVRVLAEILDEPEPTLAECWNLIRRKNGFTEGSREKAAYDRCYDATNARSMKEPFSEWASCIQEQSVDRCVLAALDAFFKEASDA
jgi:hypothetical protein